MAFPTVIQLPDFQDLLHMAQITFTLPTRGTTLSLGGGEDIFSSFGPPLWKGTINLAPDYHDESEDVVSLLRQFNATGQLFNLSPVHLVNDGAAIGEIHSSSAANLMAIGGVTVGRAFKRNTFFTLFHGGKTFLHQMLEPAVADGLGNTPEVEIWPALFSGWTVGDEVRFSRPILKAKLVGDSLSDPSIRPLISSGTSFLWTQTHR